MAVVSPGPVSELESTGVLETGAKTVLLMLVRSNTPAAESHLGGAGRRKNSPVDTLSR